MLPKPAHLGPEYAAQFGDQGVVQAYRHRPPYPDEVFAILADLIVDEPRHVLDAGCGTGEIARRLAPMVDRVDAVDVSLPMIELGRRSPGGNHPHLVWIHAAAETAEIRPPYALMTAGASLHWLAWEVALPRFARALAEHGALAIVDQTASPTPWDDELQPIIDRYSTNREYRPYDLLAELSTRGLFHPAGERRTAPIAFSQTVAEYVESYHARNGFSRERMGPERAAAFDAAAAAVVSAHRPSGRVDLEIVGVVTWGAPASP